MSRKDYRLIASIINEAMKDDMVNKLEARSAISVLAYRFARELKAENSAFKPDTFIDSCGVN